MKKHKTSRFAFLSFMLLDNYVIYTYFFIPLLMRNYLNMAYFIPLIILLVTPFFIAALPKKIGIIPFMDRIKKSYLSKYAYVVVRFLSTLLNLTLTAYVLSKVFFHDSNIIIFLLAILLVGSLISRNEPSVILNSASFLMLLGIISIILPLFISNEVKDYTLLFPLNIPSNLQYSLLLLYVFFDTVILCLENQSIEKPIKKWQFLIPLSFIFGHYALELWNVILVSGTNYLISNEFLGYFTLYIQDTINYIGNVGCVYLFVLPIAGTYKLGLSLNQFKRTLDIKENYLSFLILSLILFILAYLLILFVPLFQFVFYSIMISTVLLFIVYLFVLLNRGEHYEVRF